MTDYLGQLVLRGRHPDLAIEPRRASRFEPSRQSTVVGPGAPWEADGQPLTAPDSSRDDLAPGAIGRRVPRQDEDMPAGSAEPVDSDITPSITRRDTAGVHTRRIRRREVPPDPSASQVEPSVSSMPEERVDRSPHSADAPASARRKAYVAEPVDEPIVAGEHVERQGDRPRRDMQPALEPERRSDVRSPARTGDGNAVAPPRAATTAPRSTPGVKPSMPHAVFTPTVSTRLTPDEIERPAAAESPTIHVTIGRVEIRATSAPPLPRKASPRPPAMSLEQYLKQRRGASRE